MYNRYLLGLALLVAGTMPTFSQVSDDNEDGVVKMNADRSRYDFVEGQVLVKFKDESPVKVSKARGLVTTNVGQLTNILEKYGANEMDKVLPNEKPGRQLRKSRAFNGETIQEKDLSQLYCVKLGDSHRLEVLEAVKELKALKEVEFAEPNYKLHTLAMLSTNYNNNPNFSSQWYLNEYGVKDLWSKPIINNERPVIAILDTGVDITHPDLKDNLWTNKIESEGLEGVDNDGNGLVYDIHGWDFINNTGAIRDNNKHGTHVAGIAAASDNSLGIIGANPLAYIMPVTVMQSDGTGDVATIIKGINYAVANGASVLNLSLGTYANSHALRQALEKAYQTAVIVAAAGNDYNRIHLAKSGSCADPNHKCEYGKMFPAAYSFVLGVQAITSTGELASFSNHDNDGNTYSSELTATDPDGFNYELKAPGTNILSTIPGGKYENLNGTSMAAPLVAGAISALKMVKQYDTQEILWGDLLHSSNILGAYNLTSRPAELDFLRLQFRERKELADETEEDYSDDGRIDAGETVIIYPIIRTTFGEASNIKMHLEMGDEFEDPSTVEIITDENNKVDFGWHLDAYGKGVSANPLKVKIADNVADNRHIKMKVVATCDESTTIFEEPFTMVVDNIIKINGFVDEDMTLTAEHIYFVDNDMIVKEGATLTIEPGTTIVFHAGRSLTVFGTLIANGTPGKLINFESHVGEAYWGGIFSKSTPRTVLRYCKLSHFSMHWSEGHDNRPYFENCIITDVDNWAYTDALDFDGECCNVTENLNNGMLQSVGLMKYNNIINNRICALSGSGQDCPDWISITNCNYFNTFNDEVEGKTYYIKGISGSPSTIRTEEPSYLGTSREDLIRPHVWEFGNNPTGTTAYALIDLSNMLTEPVKEAHGIVWKVVVNGKDAQDEFEDLPPLGVGKHKFEVYFNRPMNKAVIPQISFGVRDPYNQQVVAEDGSWNDEGTIYTAYKTITGKTKSDGLNRIYVHGAQDNEFFEIPYEKTRFNIIVQAAGSMATGFSAEAGLGRVNLTWDNTNNNFDDAMGFNVYRYGSKMKTVPAHYDNNGNWVGETQVPDTVRLNENILDISAKSFIDYEVTPGETYYYYYKVLSTDLQEYDISNVVAATPLTSTLGDANGSGDVNVSDVVWTVNYAVGMDPKPFIFEAADVNTDQTIDILDVVGIVNLAMSAARPMTRDEAAQAVYTIEDGILYVETPISLAGLQVQLSVDKKSEMKTADGLKGFEQASTWLTDNDYMLMAYNFGKKTLEPGKHALLYIGDAELTDIRVSDIAGQKVNVVAGSGTTAIDGTLLTKTLNKTGIYNLNGQKVAGNADRKLQHGVYIINGQKVVK